MFSTNREFLKVIFILLVIFIGYWHLIPEPLFDDPFSTVVYDYEGELLGARNSFMPVQRAYQPHINNI